MRESKMQNVMADHIGKRVRDTTSETSNMIAIEKRTGTRRRQQVAMTLARN